MLTNMIYTCLHISGSEFPRPKQNADIRGDTDRREVVQNESILDAQPRKPCLGLGGHRGASSPVCFASVEVGTSATFRVCERGVGLSAHAGPGW